VLVMVANDVREARFTGNPNWLLDMTPETSKLGDEALPVGKPFADALPGGPKFTLVSVDASKAVIQVELQGKPAEAGHAGKGICSDTTDYQPAAPVNCVAPPTPAAPAPDGGALAADGGAPADGQASAGSTRPTSGSDAGDVVPPEPEPTTGTARPSSGGCGVAPGAAGGAGSVLLISWLAGSSVVALGARPVPPIAVDPTSHHAVSLLGFRQVFPASRADLLADRIPELWGGDPQEE
jgi:hypothetical protein